MANEYNIDIYYGSPYDEQPDWREDDPDDEIDDNDDPQPVNRPILAALLGFDPSGKDSE